MAKRQLRLGAFMRPVSIHTGAWRYPGAWPDANFNFSHIKRLIQKLEAGKFDVAMGGISITLDRQKKGLFSTPIMREGKTPIARCIRDPCRYRQESTFL